MKKEKTEKLEYRTKSDCINYAGKAALKHGSRDDLDKKIDDFINENADKPAAIVIKVKVARVVFPEVNWDDEVKGFFYYRGIPLRKVNSNQGFSAGVSWTPKAQYQEQLYDQH